MNVNDFIQLEVQNQGFNLGTKEGQLRVKWMQEAWNTAKEIGPEVRVDKFIEFIDNLGKLVEHEKNGSGFRSDINVRVGNRFAPHYGDVKYLMELLKHWRPETKKEYIEWYRYFEIIHPFVDGNGRVGKILYNWWLEALDDPEMPPDLFGGGIP